MAVLAAHSDAPLVCAARNAVHWLTEFVHSENHDYRTNGETFLLDCLGDEAITVLDIGANRGGWATEARRRCPNASIYCFEISSKTRDHLRTAVAHLQGVSVLDYGLSDHRGGEQVKYFPEQDVLTSRYDFPHGGEFVWMEEKVETGDHFVQTHGIEHIDLLKIDTEGADYRVLKGFGSMLSRGSISVVQFEYGFACILARVFLLDFYEYLQSKNYVVGKLGRGGVEFRKYRLQDENFFGPNFVAVHRSHETMISRVKHQS